MKGGNGKGRGCGKLEGNSRYIFRLELNLKLVMVRELGFGLSYGMVILF